MSMERCGALRHWRPSSTGESRTCTVPVPPNPSLNRTRNGMSPGPRSTEVMTYACTECGKIHDELPQFFMWRLPETPDRKTIAIAEDRKSMGRTKDGLCFIHCEVELPVHGHSGTVLGFICWVEVEPDVYEQILRFRENEKKRPPFSQLMEGRLANPVQGVNNSYGTKVRFKVIAGDPTPYIKWAPASSSLGRRMKIGATAKFWHRVASKMIAAPNG